MKKGVFAAAVLITVISLSAGGCMIKVLELGSTCLKLFDPAFHLRRYALVAFNRPTKERFHI